MSKSIVSAAEHRQRIAESEKALELLKAERDRVASAIEQWEERAEERKAAAARAAAMESNLRRSKMMLPKRRNSSASSDRPHILPFRGD